MPKFTALAALRILRRHRVQRYAKDFARRVPVHVLPAAEGLDQPVVLAQVRQNAQFDLRIVGTDEHVAFAGNECLADLTAKRSAYGNVL